MEDEIGLGEHVGDLESREYEGLAGVDGEVGEVFGGFEEFGFILEAGEGGDDVGGGNRGCAGVGDGELDGEVAGVGLVDFGFTELEVPFGFEADEVGEDEDEQGEGKVLAVAEEAWEVEFWGGNSVEEVLEEAEGASEGAHESAEEGADGEYGGDGEDGDLVYGGGEGHDADGARGGGDGAAVAVESWGADGFEGLTGEVEDFFEGETEDVGVEDRRGDEAGGEA